MTSTAYHLEFGGRVKAARERRGDTQQQMADLLGISQGKYKQYEGRSLMPHELIPEFTKLCAIDYEWLFTGVGRGPLWASIEKKQPRLVRGMKRD